MKQGKALKWWDRTIKEGERLGARPDLSRTYFEVGKRLLEPHSKYKELNGIRGQGIPGQGRKAVPGDGPPMGPGATGAGPKARIDSTAVIIGFLNGEKELCLVNYRMINVSNRNR